ncbi:MAG: oligopeptidase A [Candidatus Thiodiazotropha lotti]|uniref:oligopeptidase A n=1 Tax=Candidatus Thiodiazotropha endoloripes TaxID=1818881 RepID=UPI00083D14D1|nr:oligopeptidase A [Candidatus Thiodiazotropha endoloripes]MCG7898179.1 oligopeptidase A [Candidatus Thiodiazotropha weberae]MCG7991294.1 oligopeptidase A [Candidatus Thiodiazotropha lotti]MCG7903129.1 oligopeptidase A [Candidatus Thiodiazotropha weberae]MCG7915091.1 oligopeptidase A [Candidatus Thiodiazotropha weberae]MCG7998320.1 oligopeptidase A [Candidatus Thiodiazotropha lotti]
MTNALLDMTGLPPFSRIEPPMVEPAIDTLLQENRQTMESLLSTISDPGWHNFVEPLEIAEDRLSRTWSPVSHMNSVVNHDELREVYNACLPKLSDYATEVGQNSRLCEAYKKVAEQQDLDNAQKKMLENTLLEFRLSGVDLPEDKKQRFKEISQSLSKLTTKFEENLLDATNAWSKLITDPEQLAGLPESAMALAKQTAEQREQQGWLLTLEFPSYFPVMTYADQRELRRELYEAYATRASDCGPHAGQWDNSEVMEQILALRHEQAQLLGYNNYAERSLARKMARNTEEVMSFLTDLAQRSKAQAERELADLTQFASENYGIDQLEAWDIGYYSEKLRQHRHAISQEELKPYFPETRVIPGMFAVVERLYGIRIQSVEGVDTWHPDVRFYEIRDKQNQLRGQFYLDLYARPKKRGGAWMDECATRFFSDSVDQVPVAYLTCNFSPPVGDQPALFTHDEVETLFHEFGHGLHHMLTRIDYPSVAGINGVAWDAVELPSQFMENWCWEQQALELISGHVESGEPIPDELYQRLHGAKNFQSAMQMVRQLEFSIFDFRIHQEYDPEQGGRIYQILDQVREQVSVISPPSWNRFPHGFSHIFAGGYAAGYYSYKWAEVLSADAFSRFEEQGIFSQEAGQAFLQEILEQGGSKDAMELFVAFRGREPQIEPLLRHSGISG